MSLRFPVTIEKETELRSRLAQLGIREEDLLERFVRAQGPGGQHVNKSSTAVYLKHLPTGVEVKAQQARSQGLNRFFARRQLADAVEALRGGQASAEQTRRDKLRKQKQRRARRSRHKGST